MTSSGRLLKLASTIQTNTARIDELLSSEDISTLSLSPTSYNDIKSSENAILEAMDDLRSLLSKPLRHPSQEIIQTNPVQLAYLGMGVMGQAMSKNLAQKGNLSKPIILWNRTLSRAVSHSNTIGNAIVAETLSEAVSESDIIWSCLSNQEAVISSFDAILGTDIRGKLFVECSTISPEATNKLAEKVINAGAEFVAMPVFGERAMAIAGILICVPAGKASSVDRILPFLEGVVGRHVINLSQSAPGTASHLKLIGNLLIIGMVECVASAHVFAEKSGMDTDKVHEVIKACFPNPFAIYSKRMSSGDYYQDKPLANVAMVKEITEHVLDLAKESGMELKAYEIGCKHLEDVAKYNGSNGDISEIYGALRMENGLKFEN